MILRLAIIFFCIYLSTVTVRSHAAAQARATGNDADDNERLYQTIKDIFGSPDVPASTPIPDIQGNNSDERLYQTIKDIFGSPDVPASTPTPDIQVNSSERLDQTIQDIFGVPDVPASTRTPDIQGSSGSIPGVASCTCVPYYLCHNGSINTNSEGIIDIIIKDRPCESYIEVCCNAEDRSEVPITPAPPITKQSGCGLRHPNGVGFRIIGGKEHEAQFGEFPWMVAVLREETVEGFSNKVIVYQCGGALIHPQVVVTAAHCVIEKNKSFKIRAGEWDTQSTQELYPHQDREVKTIVMHPQYYVVENDVALLHLRAPVEIAENVDTVCLPPQGTIIGSATCFETGWGKVVAGQKGKYQVILKKIDLLVVPNGQCQSQLRTTRLGNFFFPHDSNMCAGGIPGKDPCKGDGGSPLVCPIPGSVGRYYQIGIASWSIGCGESGTPGIYANLPLFREWIDTQMKAFGLDASAYRY